MELDGSKGIQLPPPRSMDLAVNLASSVSSSLATHLDEESMWQMSLRMGGNIDSGPYPERPGEPDCAYYLRTGLCRFGITCKFNHPANRKLAVARMKGDYPERLGQPECQYYLRTGLCNFGPTCKFHHPKDKTGIIGRVQVNILGFPLRPNEKECAYYLRTGLCKFGLTCKFHHPQPSNATLSLRGSPVYHAVHPQPSNASPGGQSLTGALTNWPLSKPSFINSRWHGLSSYATQLFLPQGLVQVPSWSTFPQGQFGSVSSAETQQANSGSTHLYGTSHQRETATGSSTSFSSFRTSSVPMGQYMLQSNSVFPERPGEPECQFYMKTGDCKFGAVCKFHHPTERRIPDPDCVLSPMGFPLRPNEPLCLFYSRYGTCKFGANCKFDHPMPSSTGSFAYNRFTSSRDAPVVRGPLGPPLSPRAITFSSDGSAETGHGKSRRLSPSDSQQMGSSDENDG